MHFDRVFYQKIKQEVETSERAYKKRYGWIAVCATVLSGVLLWYLWIQVKIEDFQIFGIAFFPMLIYFAGKNVYAHRAEGLLLKKIAEENGGTYRESFSVEGEHAVMFRQGHDQSGGREVSFQDGSGENIRFFEYSFVVGYDKHKKTYKYHVFSIKNLGTTPHLYLNYKKNKYSMSLGKVLSLPAEFEKNFTMSVPEGYHLEALQIFTPDVLDKILNLPLKCDIEIVNGEVLFFLENIGSIFKNFSELEIQIESAKTLVAILKPKLSNLRWAPIGDKSFSL